MQTRRGRADGFERLQFRFQAEAIARLGLDSRGSVASHVGEHCANFLRQRSLARLPHAVDAGTNSSARFGDLFVVRARNPLLEIHQPRMREYRMSMGIDEAGQDDAPAAIDLADLLPILFQPRIAESVFRRADRNDLPAQTEHGSVFDHPKFGKGSAASRIVRG